MAVTLTNRHGLPLPIVRAVQNDPYDRGDCDFSVTQLLRPPQLARLASQHETTEDVADRIWALLGQAVHVILERAAMDEVGALAETRKYMAVEVDGKPYRISGSFDHLTFVKGCLTDYKITSVYARAGKAEWEAQLNLLRIILAANGYTAVRLQNVLIFRDWRPKEALREDYPESQVGVITVDLWPAERAYDYLVERIREHVAATPRPCSDEERWHQPDVWALMKKGRKKAIRLFEKRPDHIALDKEQFIEHRPGAYRRCESYCDVASVCPQLAAERAPEEKAA